MKGGRGPDSEAGVEAPDDVVDCITGDALALLVFRADLAILLDVVVVVPVLACSPLVVFGVTCSSWLTSDAVLVRYWLGYISLGYIIYVSGVSGMYRV